MTPHPKIGGWKVVRAKRSILVTGALACGIATQGCETLSKSERPQIPTLGAVSVYAKTPASAPLPVPTAPVVVQAQALERVPTATPAAVSTNIELASAFELAGADNPTEAPTSAKLRRASSVSDATIRSSRLSSCNESPL